MKRALKNFFQGARRVFKLRATELLDTVIGPLEPIEPPRRGRPSKLTKEAKAAVCEELTLGKSLREVCLMEGFPDISNVIRCLQRDLDFRAQYIQARKLQEEIIFDQIHYIADTPQRGIKITTKPDGSVETTEADMIEHRRLQIESRKWLLGRMSPKKYGDKIEVDMPNGGSNLTQIINVVQQQPVEAARSYQNFLADE